MVAFKKVKLRKADDGLPKEFLREVESLRYLSHEHIVTILEVFVGKTNINIVYEFMNTDLDKFLDKLARPLSILEVSSCWVFIIIDKSDNEDGGGGVERGT